MIDGLGISYEIALIWMLLGLNHGKSTLVQIMAWCRQAISHYLSQYWPIWVNSPPPGQNRCHFADNIFKCIYANEKFSILIQISSKDVSMCPIDNNSSLIQVMAWRRTSDKPLLEAMSTHIIDAYMRHQGRWVNCWINQKMLMSSKALFTVTYIAYGHFVQWYNHQHIFEYTNIVPIHN